MPTHLIRSRTEDHKSVEKWYFPRMFDVDPIKVEAIRKEYLKHRDEMLIFQKECAARGDRDGAKFFKDESREALKMYRASCLILPYYTSDHSSDCKLTDTYKFPPELWRALEFVVHVAAL